MLDDTHGYFVIGGGKFIRGIEGYHGPATYYRIQGLPADQVGYNSIFRFLYFIFMHMVNYFESDLHCIQL